MKQELFGAILLAGGALASAISGYSYLTAYPDPDGATQAAYYLGASAALGSQSAEQTFNERFHGDEAARLAYEHGMMSVEPVSKPL
jgi:hypothetical protein